ncbi:MAG: hypothetical protein JRJ19_15640, partial [Deltaproteobacteria bacterium]|nr:hypothetical protein [Deltaproteobacteria bacterium]
SKEGSKDFEAEFLGKMSDFQLRTALNYLRVWERFGGSKLLKAPKEKSSKKK